MAVHVTHRLAAELRTERTVSIRVRSAAPADALDLAMTDLRGVFYTLGGSGREVAGPAYVSEPVAVPGGRLLLVDFGRLHPRARVDLPERLTAALERQGVTDAEADVPPELGDRYETLRTFQPVVRTWLRWEPGADAPRRMRPPPGGLVDLVLDWLWSRDRPGHETLALAIAHEVPLTRDRGRDIVDAIARGQPVTTVYTTDFTTTGSTAAIGEFRGLGASLATADAAPSPDGLAAHMREQRDLIRAHAARLAWAGITVLPDDNLYPGATRRHYDAPHATPMWYQLLTPAQLGHLGDEARARTRTLAARTELELGAPGPWIPTHPHHQATLDDAHRLLGP